LLIAIQSARDDTITVDAQRCRVENVEKGRKSYESQPPVVKSLRSLKLEVGVLTLGRNGLPSKNRVRLRKSSGGAGEGSGAPNVTPTKIA